MEPKIPTTLWKTQLLKLVSEAPKALSVECTDLGYQRFPSSSSTSGDDGSDQSIGSSGSVTEFHHRSTNQLLLLETNNGTNKIHHHSHSHPRRKKHDPIDHISINDVDDDDESKSLAEVVDTLAALEMECLNFSLKTANSTSIDSNSTSDHSHSHSHSPSPQPPVKSQKQFQQSSGRKSDPSNGSEVVVMRRTSGLLMDNSHRQFTISSVEDHNEMRSAISNSDSVVSLTGGKSGSGTTAAAPWHRPSVYLFNPFGKVFHGYLSQSETHQLLTQDGQFLVRKREKDNDDDFVLSFRFNGHLKNFIITFDDTSGLIYVGDRDKGYETLQELVQEGLVTMYLEHKAGPYIDLMCDLTRYNNHYNHQHQSYNHHNSSRTTTPNGSISNRNSKSVGKGSIINGHLFTMSPSTHKWNASSSSKQNSPSPSVSSLSRSSMERQGRNPDLKTHSFQIHTFQDLSKCQICQNFLWGLASQGLLCKDCGFIIHESCLERVVHECEPQLSKIPSIFGADLTVLVKATGGTKPPFLIEKCVTEIEKRGLHIEGIYRVSGSKELMEKLKTLLEKEREGADLSKHVDTHSMCGLVKFFFRQLPQPLITKEVFQRIINASSNGPMTLEAIRRDLKRLPQANYISFKFLLQHLNRVAQRSDKNKMNPFNLASVFSPSLVCHSQTTVETLKIATAVVELMITQVPNLFPKS